MARLLPLILVFCLAAWGASDEAITAEAIAAYRALQRRIEQTRRNASKLPDPQATLESLSTQRDSLDAQYPFKPKEPAALAAERKKTDQDLKALTRILRPERKTTSAPPRKTPPRKKAPARKPR